MLKLIKIALIIIPFIHLNAQEKDSQLVQEARKAIEESNKIYASLANNGDGSILTRYTDDACLLPPNASPVCGREAIINFFKNGPKVQVKFTIQNLYGDAREYVTEESHYQMWDANGVLLDEGKIIVVWKKTDQGWKMHRDMFSSNREK